MGGLFEKRMGGKFDREIKVNYNLSYYFLPIF